MDGWVEARAGLRIAYSNKKSSHCSSQLRLGKTVIAMLCVFAGGCGFGYWRATSRGRLDGEEQVGLWHPVHHDDAQERDDGEG